jgi:DNA-binding MarR family transcriptional regulator
MQTSATSAEQLAGQLMRFVTHVMKAKQEDFLRVIAELDLTLPQMRALFVLGQSERALALTELAPRMGLSVAAAGRAVDGLVRDGLISRSEDLEDRRVKRLALTERGRETTARVAGARLEGLRQFAETLDEEGRERLAHGLAPVLEQLDRDACGPTATR